MRVFLVAIAIIFSLQSWAQSKVNTQQATNVVVSGNAVMVVNGDVINSGSVTIRNNGSLIQTGSADNNQTTGTYTVERSGHNALLAYNMWSSPIKSAQIHGTGGVFASANPCDMYVFNASTQEWKYDYAAPYSTTCNGSPVTFSASGMMTDGTADNIMDVGRGYFIPGDGTAIRTFTGDVNNGNVTIPIFETSLGNKPSWSGDDWNMVGNPYPSSISMEAFWNANSPSVITDGLYFWVDDGSGGSGYQENNSYLVYNATGSAVGGTNNNGVSQPVAVNFMASGQGFWVHAVTNGNLEFTNSMRQGTGYTNDNFYKRSADIQRAWISLDRGNGVRSNQILLGLTDDATVGYDPKYDARRMHSTSTIELSFVQDTANYQILGQPSISYDEQGILPLFVHNDSAGIHSFYLDSTQNVNNGISYYIIDSLYNTVHDLQVPYTVMIDTGDHANRFYLLYKDIVNSIDEPTHPVFFVKAYQSGEVIKLQSNKLNISNVEIYSAIGRLITSNRNLNQADVTINVSSFAKGVYLIHYELENGIAETQKIVIH